MKTVIILTFISLFFACSKQEIFESKQGFANDSIQQFVSERTLSYFYSDFTYTNEYGYFPGWYYTGLPEEYNTYKIEPDNGQCKITIKKEDVLKYAYMRTLDLWFIYGHTYKVSLDVTDIETFYNMSMLNVSLFNGATTVFISKLGWSKSQVVKHWEWIITANTIEPMQAFIAVSIPTNYQLPADQWINIDNFKIEEQ